MTGNGNYVNLLKLPFVKSHHVNFVFGGFGPFGTTVRRICKRTEGRLRREGRKEGRKDHYKCITITEKTRVYLSSYNGRWPPRLRPPGRPGPK
jgi:hypothetical protein